MIKAFIFCFILFYFVGAKALNKIGQASRKASNKAVDTFLNEMEKNNK